MNKNILLSLCILSFSASIVNAVHPRKIQRQLRCALCGVLLTSSDALVNQGLTNTFYCVACYDKLRGKEDGVMAPLAMSLGGNMTTYGTFDDENYYARKAIDEDIWQLTEQDVKKKRRKKRLNALTQIDKDMRAEGGGILRWPFTNVGEIIEYCSDEYSLDVLDILLKSGIDFDSEKNDLYLYQVNYNEQGTPVSITVTKPDADPEDVPVEITSRVYRRGAQLMIENVTNVVVKDFSHKTTLDILLNGHVHEYLRGSYLKTLEFSEIVL